jgi:uncharacterized membrane protein YeaQ/YmgE (transglycosylase-associated protein family)
MIGMDFISFLILLIISIVVSGILHFGLKYHNKAEWRTYVSKVGAGWFGAWLGSPVFGYWWQGLNYKEVYIVPAILGAIVPIVFSVELLKVFLKLSSQLQANNQSASAAGVRCEGG